MIEKQFSNMFKLIPCIFIPNKICYQNKCRKSVILSEKRNKIQRRYTKLQNWIVLCYLKIERDEMMMRSKNERFI